MPAGIEIKVSRWGEGEPPTSGIKIEVNGWGGGVPSPAGIEIGVKGGGSAVFQCWNWHKQVGWQGTRIEIEVKGGGICRRRNQGEQRK